MHPLGHFVHRPGEQRIFETQAQGSPGSSDLSGNNSFVSKNSLECQDLEISEQPGPLPFYRWINRGPERGQGSAMATRHFCLPAKESSHGPTLLPGSQGFCTPLPSRSPPHYEDSAPKLRPLASPSHSGTCQELISSLQSPTCHMS